MLIVKLICFFGMFMFFIYSITIFAQTKNISNWLKVGILITSIPMFLGMFYVFTEAMKHGKKSESIKYELIQEPVHRKSK